jgi:hypothetical protein
MLNDNQNQYNKNFKILKWRIIKMIKSKPIHLIIVLLLVLLGMLLFWGFFDYVFVPFNSAVITLFAIAVIIGFTVIGIKYSKDNLSYIPCLLPPIAAVFLFLSLQTLVLGFIMHSLLILVTVICSMILFYKCTQNTKSKVLNVVVSVGYILASMVITLGMLFYMSVFVYSADPVIVEPTESPNGNFSVIVRRGAAGGTVAIVSPNNGINILIGSVRWKSQRFVVEGMSSDGSHNAEVQWHGLGDSSFSVFCHDRNVYIDVSRDSGRWRDIT